MAVTLVKKWLEKIYIQQCTPQEMNNELKKIGCRSKMHGKFIAENVFQPMERLPLICFQGSLPTCTFSKVSFTTVRLL